MTTNPLPTWSPPGPSGIPSPSDPPVVPDRLESIRRPVEADLAAVDTRILENLDSKVPLIRETGEYLISQGGKRLRPLLALLAARAFGYEGRAHVDAAVVIEFIHTATLLHDDVVDRSTMRRGRETANSIWGGRGQRPRRRLSLLARVSAHGRDGEPSHHADHGRRDQRHCRGARCCSSPTVTTPTPPRSATSKSSVARPGSSSRRAARVGAVLAARGEADERCMSAFGASLGTAYQLVDDVLDYRGTAAAIGKNIGDDLGGRTAHSPSDPRDARGETRKPRER